MHIRINKSRRNTVTINEKEAKKEKMKKNKCSKAVLGAITAMALCMLASLPLVPPVFAANDNVLVDITPSSAAPQNTSTVAVTVRGVTDLGAGTLTVAYNPSVCTVTDVKAGDLSILSKNISVPGLLRISAMDTQGHTGDVTFAKPEIKAVGSSGDSTPLTLTVETLKTYGPPIGDIPAADIRVSSGTFSILTEPESTPAVTFAVTPTPIPTPTPTSLPTPVPSPTPKPSGFEHIFVIAGFISAAYLVLRIRTAQR